MIAPVTMSPRLHGDMEYIAGSQKKRTIMKKNDNEKE